MKGLEAAIRKALHGPGGSDPPQRERIYTAARRALANSLEKQGIADSDHATEQSETLDRLISAIESEYWAEPPPPDLDFGEEPAALHDMAGSSLNPDSAKTQEPGITEAQDPADIAEYIRDALHGQADPVDPEGPVSEMLDIDFPVPDPARPEPSSGAEQPRPPSSRDRASQDPAPPPIDFPADVSPATEPPAAEAGGSAPTIEADPPLVQRPSKAAKRPKAEAFDVDPVIDDAPGPELAASDAELRLAPGHAPRSADRDDGAAPKPELADAPEAVAPDVDARTHRVKERELKKGRRRPVFSLILVAALAVAFVGIGAVWVMVSGILQTPEQRDTSVPNPPATVQSEDFAGRPSIDGAFSGDWIDVFVPDDLSRVTGGSGALVDLVESGRGDALRITSTDGGQDGEVLFELEPALLRGLDGRPFLVALTARTAGEAPTQIYVRCQLPGGNDCGRYRFDVAYAEGDIVFRIDPVGDAGQSGFLAVNSDVTGSGGGIDLYGIRIRPQ